MSGPLRVEYPGAIRHVMCWGNGRQRVFHDEADHRRLIDGLGLTVRRLGWESFFRPLRDQRLGTARKSARECDVGRIANPSYTSPRDDPSARDVGIAHAHCISRTTSRQPCQRQAYVGTHARPAGSPRGSMPSRDGTVAIQELVPETCSPIAPNFAMRIAATPVIPFPLRPARSSSR